MRAGLIENDLRPLTPDELAQLDRIATDRERDAAFRRAHPELFEPIVSELTGEEAVMAWLESGGMPLLETTR